MAEQGINALERVADADDFRELERSRVRALVERNMELARLLHATEFQLITPTGHSYTRDQYLGEIEVDSGGGYIASFRCWHTDSYELVEGFWQVVWSQATAIK